MNQENRIEKIIMEEQRPTIKQTPKSTGITVPSTQATADWVDQSTFVPADTFEKALEVVGEQISFMAVNPDGSETEVQLRVESLQDLEADPQAALLRSSGAIQRIPALRRLYVQNKALHLFLGKLKGNTVRAKLEPIFQNPALKAQFAQALRAKTEQLLTQENLPYYV